MDIRTDQVAAMNMSDQKIKEAAQAIMAMRRPPVTKEKPAEEYKRRIELDRLNDDLRDEQELRESYE